MQEPITARKQLLSLYKETIKNVEKDSSRPTFKDQGRQMSADNLAVYEQIKSIPFQKINEELEERGLTPFINKESHLLSAFERLLQHFGEVKDEGDSLKRPTKRNSQALLDWRSKLLLGGPRQGANIMVTLDSSRHRSIDELENLCQQGMTLARINGGRDEENILADWFSWGSQLSDSYSLRIGLDLPGDTLRIPSLQKKKGILKVPVRYNEYFIDGTLTPVTTQSIVEKQTVDQSTFTLYVKDISLSSFKKGDKLKFHDYRGRKRKLHVLTDPVGDNLQVRLYRNAYIENQTTLYYKKKMIGTISGIPSSPVTLSVTDGDKLRIRFDSSAPEDHMEEDGAFVINSPAAKFFENLQAEEPFLIDDGKISGVVQISTPEYVELLVQHPKDQRSPIEEQRSIVFPEQKNLSPSLSNPDRELLEKWGKQSDFILLSFVENAEQLQELKKELERLNLTHLGVMAKIESERAVENIDTILKEGLSFQKFGVMLGRGDLLAMVASDELPHMQRTVLKSAKAAHLPVIIATGLLQRTAKTGQAHQAELIDVEAAKEAEGVMLNKGNYTSKAVSLAKAILEK
ncbi:pyruvate kinase [Salsuginibacillus kocurii]|uniref:pyruvate kinase n=1 Tax=Salsuginibacillus kocurii TaxID=427078 RepID=UPI00036FC265|nr:pyruvate kinase [Salsuginibacillus kocurii]